MHWFSSFDTSFFFFFGKSPKLRFVTAIQIFVLAQPCGILNIDVIYRVFDPCR